MTASVCKKNDLGQTLESYNLEEEQAKTRERRKIKKAAEKMIVEEEKEPSTQSELGKRRIREEMSKEGLREP